MTEQTITVVGARGGCGASAISAALALFASRVATTELVVADADTAAALLGLGVVQHPSAPIGVADGISLVSSASGTAQVVVVDAGRLDDVADTLAGVRLVVLRGPCYLGLRSIVMGDLRPDGIMLLAEAGRSLTRHDVEDVCGAPVVAQIHVTSNVARTIDAGLFATRAHALSELIPLRNYVTASVPVPDTTPDTASSARLQHPSNRSPQHPHTPSSHPDLSTPTTPFKIVTDMPVPLCGTGRAAPVVSRTRAGARHSLLKRHRRRDGAEHREAESGSDRVLRR
jgi:hypothetical protein